jgi:hypothetical protein
VGVIVGKDVGLIWRSRADVGSGGRFEPAAETMLFPKAVMRMTRINSAK